jgi:hypothetical protein
MGRLFDTIRQLVIAERYVVGQHASERLEERGVLEWQAVAGIDDGELILERPDAKPRALLSCVAHGRSRLPKDPPYPPLVRGQRYGHKFSTWVDSTGMAFISATWTSVTEIGTGSS